MKTNSYLFIINPISGSHSNRKRILDRVKRMFSNQSFQIRFTEYPGHATVLAKQAVEEGVAVVVAIGGDGTMHEVASGLVGTSSALGLVPRGSGNGFARSLGIPLQTDKALSVLQNYRFEQVDVGVINQEYFFGVAGVGLDARIAVAFQNFGKRGALPYYYIGLKEYKQYKYPKIRIESEEQTREFNPMLITIANTQQYGNGAFIAPQADYTDGRLDVCIVDPFPVRTIPKNLKQLFGGAIRQNPFYHSFTSRRLTIIQQDPEGRFHVDGEPRSGGQILEISIRSKALRVCVNR